MLQIVIKNHYCVVNLQRKLKLYLRDPIPIFLSWKRLFVFFCFLQIKNLSPCEKHLQSKYKNLRLRKSRYSVQIREDTDQKESPNLKIFNGIVYN